jgi:hypothetical protein
MLYAFNSLKGGKPSNFHEQLGLLVSVWIVLDWIYQWFCVSSFCGGINSSIARLYGRFNWVQFSCKWRGVVQDLGRQVRIVAHGWRHRAGFAAEAAWLDIVNKTKQIKVDSYRMASYARNGLNRCLLAREGQANSWSSWVRWSARRRGLTAAA